MRKAEKPAPVQPIENFELPKLPMLLSPVSFMALPYIYVKVPSEVVVGASYDLANRYEALFFVQLKPKGMVFPSDFFIARGINTAKEVEEYIQQGEDLFIGEENWFWAGKDEEEEIIKPLPPPFNNKNVEAQLTWTQQDVTLEEEAKILWNIYKHTYTKDELNAEKLDRLRLIARVKEAKSAPNKPTLIANILSKQSPPEEKLNEDDGGSSEPEEEEEEEEMVTASRRSAEEDPEGNFNTAEQPENDPFKDKEVKVSFRYMFKVGSPDPPLQVNDVLYTGAGKLIGKITGIAQEDKFGETYTIKTSNGLREKVHSSYLASVKATKQKKTTQQKLF
jgi:hypothetical protein